MSTTLIHAVENIVDPGPRRKQWTRDEVVSLAESGVVDVDHLELIEGELYDQTGQCLAHVNTLHQLVILLNEVFGIYRVTPKRPVEVASKDRPSNEPQPDIVVLSRRFDSFKTVPEPENLTLVVEISDTTLRFDLKTKAAVYARAGIVEYWVVDVNGRRLIVHREPKEGRYSTIVAYGVDDSISPLAAPEHVVEVRSIFD